MRKKIVYIGLALIVIAIASFFITGALLGGSLRNGLMSENLTVQAGSFASLPLVLGNQSVVVVQASLSAPAYVYVLNNATYLRWAAQSRYAKNFSGLAYAKSIAPNGTITNSAVTLAELVYPKNLSYASSVANRSIDVVVDNTNGSPSSNTAITAQLTWLQTSANVVGPYEIADVACVVLFIAGIIVAIYGAIKKRPESATTAAAGKDASQGAASQAYVNELYKGVEKEGAAHPKKPRKRKKTIGN